LRSKYPYEKISGIEMNPCEKNPVKMCAKTTKYLPKNVLKRAFKSTQNALSMYKKRNTRHLRTIFPKCSQVKSKDHYENTSGIEMRPCEKRPDEMCAKTANYTLKMY